MVYQQLISIQFRINNLNNKIFYSIVSISLNILLMIKLEFGVTFPFGELIMPLSLVLVVGLVAIIAIDLLKDVDPFKEIDIFDDDEVVRRCANE